MDHPDIEEQLRGAVLESEWSVYAIAKRSGIPQSRLSDFKNGRTLSLENAGKLAAFFGMRFTKPKHKPKPDRGQI